MSDDHRSPARGEASLRPQTLAEFVGQTGQPRKTWPSSSRPRAAAARRWTTCCCTARPGLGKTTLAQIVARELGVGFRATSGPVIQRAGDLAAILTNLQPRDVLFIDEIHRLQPAIEEVLYPAMEDFQLDLIIGEGPAARSVRIDLPPFTLVGATTRAGLLATPLRDRFGIPLRLVFYTPEELTADRRARRREAGLAPDRGRRRRDRPALARHAAHRRAAAAPGARLRRRGRATDPVDRADRRRRADPAGGGSRSGWTRWTGAICAASPSTMPAARSASRRWPRRWPRRATRWRT